MEKIATKTKRHKNPFLLFTKVNYNWPLFERSVKPKKKYFTNFNNYCPIYLSDLLNNINKKILDGNSTQNTGAFV